MDLRYEFLSMLFCVFPSYFNLFGKVSFFRGIFFSAWIYFIVVPENERFFLNENWFKLTEIVSTNSRFCTLIALPFIGILPLLVQLFSNWNEQRKKSTADYIPWEMLNKCTRPNLFLSEFHSQMKQNEMSRFYPLQMLWLYSLVAREYWQNVYVTDRNITFSRQILSFMRKKKNT